MRPTFPISNPLTLSPIITMSAANAAANFKTISKTETQKKRRSSGADRAKVGSFASSITEFGNPEELLKKSKKSRDPNDSPLEDSEGGEDSTPLPSTTTSTTTTTTTPKPRRQRAPPNVIHKIFEQAALITKDPYWSEQMRKASLGRFPRYFSFSDRTMIYKKGTKYSTKEISANPYEAACAYITFVRYHGSIFSETDNRNSTEERAKVSLLLNTEGNMSWEKIKKKARQCMLFEYISKLKTEMVLTDSEFSQLKQTIFLGIITKKFGKDNINIEEKAITRIDGLRWNRKLRYFYTDHVLTPSHRKSTSRAHAASSLALLMRSNGNENENILASPPSSKTMMMMTPMMKSGKIISSVTKKWKKFNERIGEEIQNVHKMLHHHWTLAPSGNSTKNNMPPSSSDVVNVLDDSVAIDGKVNPSPSSSSSSLLPPKENISLEGGNDIPTDIHQDTFDGNTTATRNMEDEDEDEVADEIMIASDVDMDDLASSDEEGTYD